MLINTIDSLLNSSKTDATTRTIAQFIKDHIDEIPHMTIDRMAQGCFVSKAMITKFVKRLGFESFKDFKYDVQEQVNAFSKKYPFHTFDDESLRLNAIRMMDDLTIGLRESVIAIDYDQLGRLISDIDQASVIMMIGQGDTESICRRFQSSLDYLNKDVRICDHQLERIKSLESQDIIICVSVNGYSFVYDQRLVRKINHIDQKKWLITCADVKNFNGEIIHLPYIDRALNDILVSFLLKTIANAINDKEEK